jgi:hypothetical protein
MTKEICGIVFNEMPNSLWTENHALTIFTTAEPEQSFSFSTTNIDPYTGLFSHFNCVAFSVSGVGTPAGALKLDLVGCPERIRILGINSSSFKVPLEFTLGKVYFPNLRKLIFSMQCPDDFPSLDENRKLVHLSVPYDKKFASHWNRLTQVKDLVISDFDEPDLTSLKGMTGLVRLTIADGKMKSLEGLQLLPNLQTIIIAKAPKLTNLDALIAAPALENIMVQNFKKVTDWSFLTQRKQLQHIALDSVDSVEFRKELPSLAFLYAKKVAERGNKAYLFETEGRYENTFPDGTNVKYIPDHDVFYNEL